MSDNKGEPSVARRDAAIGSSQVDPASLLSDGFLVPELEGNYGNNEQPQEAPPAYGEQHDQMQFSQPGFEAGAAITDAGRVSININTKNRRLADLLAPTIERQLQPSSEPALPPAYIPPSLGGQPGQKPPSKLNVVIQIVGSRGDVQPFVALGKVLKDTYGHRVRVATHPTFQSFVEENGLDFFSIGGDPAELMAFMVKHPGLMPGFDAIKSGEITKRRKGISEMLLGCWRSCIEAGDGLGPAPPATKEPINFDAIQDDGRETFVADAIIANPPSFAHIHVAEKLGIPLHMMFTMPWSPTRAFPHPLADIQSSNADDVMTKYLTYTLVEMMTWQGLGDVINRFREKALDLAPLSLIWAPGLLNRLKVPYTYCWSPSLIPKPNDWGNHIDISGFYFLDLATNYNPDPDLSAFLEAGPPPVYIGFGSIVVDDPNAMTEMIFDAVRQSGVRALVSKGWGGLGADEMGVPEGVFMLGNVPHDWLFQRVSAVVHHGGAGTTAAGIKAGKPTLVVPFFGDQPFWGAMIAKAKAGPDPIPYKKLTGDKLAEAISFCLKPETIEQAKAYGEKIREEKGTDVGGQSFHSHLDIDNMRCSIAPSRTAVWRVRRSKVRLSSLAAATLVEEGLIKYPDLKLYRPREYNTEDQPPDPISAAACAIVMDASGIGMAIADMPREMFKGRPKPEQQQEEGGSPSQTPEASSSQVASRTQTGEVKPGDASSTTAPAEDLSNLASPGEESSKSEMTASNQSQKSFQDSSSVVTSSADTAVTSTSNSERPAARASNSQMKQAFSSRRDSSPVGMGIDAATGVGKGVGKIVGHGVKSPMNFCLGLAKGFRNVPRLYNDETVRPVEKVTGVGSGLRVAGKEFGFGLYDGISGLVTQPLKGAEKEGVAGLVKGVGKGIGGIMTKPAAGFWGIPAYTMKGVHAEVTKMFARSNYNYIITSRVIQGRRDLRNSSTEETQDIIARWRSGSFDLKRFDQFQKKSSSGQKNAVDPAAPEGETPPEQRSPRPSWLNTRISSVDERLRGEKDRFFARADTWRKDKSGGPSGSGSGSSSVQPPAAEDAEFEQAIQASVRETSKGNADEDAAIEAAIRQSVNAAREHGSLPDPEPRQLSGTEKDPSIFADKSYQITDEEYQDLIEKAIRDSMADDKAPPYELPGSSKEDYLGDSNWESAGQQSKIDADRGSDEEQYRSVLERSKNETGSADPELQEAIEKSKREEVERRTHQLTQEQKDEIIMEQIMKESAMEAERKQQQDREKGKGKAPGQGNDDEDDEELQRALKESLKVNQGGAGGSSGA